MSNSLTQSPTSSSTNALLQRHHTSMTIRTSSSNTAAAPVADAAPTTRPKTFLEKQPYIIGYGAAISLVSPAATAYQLCRLYNVRAAPVQLLTMSASIFPQQALLKAGQMNASTPVKEHLNPWAAFAVVGILQGGVYGQANIHFSKVLGLGGNSTTTATPTKTALSLVSAAALFRGSGFAACRDMLSQGLPFMCSHHVRTNILDRYFPTTTTSTTTTSTTSSSKVDAEMVDGIKHWTSVLSTSIIATYASQFMHNCQIAMQSNQTLGYMSAVRTVHAQHGLKMLYRGAEARVGLLLLVNVLNEVLLKPAWSPVPLELELKFENNDNNKNKDEQRDHSSSSLLATSQRRGDDRQKQQINYYEEV
jgi:hypothetical protein